MRGGRGSDGRLRGMILYILSKSGRKRRTAEWLVNVLYLADLEAYRRLGHSISGKTYRKMPLGPTPSRFGHVMARMVRDGDLRLVEPKRRPVR